jgi:MFS family permease
VELAHRFGVLRQRDFRLVFGAALVSLVGDGIVPVALAFAVLDATGSATDLGVILAARTVALVGSLLAGGVLADRLGRRAVMIAADLIRLGSQAAIAALLLAGDASVAELAVSQAILGAASGFFNPASSGLLPMVAGERLQQANALQGMAMAAGNIAGPAIAAGLVVAAGPGGALMIDAASYAVSAGLLARVAVGVRPPAPESGLVSDLREGFAEVRRRTWLWSIVAAFSFVNTLAVALVVLGPLTAKLHLGGPAGWAAVLAARAVGWLGGSLGLLRVHPRRPLLVGVIGGGTIALPLALLAGPAPLPWVAVGALLAGAGGMVFNTLWETTLQQQIPDHARSRVSSYDWFGSLALQPVGYALIGPLAAAVGVGNALDLCAVLSLAAVLALLAVRDVRTLAVAAPVEA